MSKLFKQLGPEEFPLIEQVYYPNHKEMVSALPSALLHSLLPLSTHVDGYFLMLRNPKETHAGHIWARLIHFHVNILSLVAAESNLIFWGSVLLLFSFRVEAEFFFHFELLVCQVSVSSCWFRAVIPTKPSPPYRLKYFACFQAIDMNQK